MRRRGRARSDRDGAAAQREELARKMKERADERSAAEAEAPASRRMGALRVFGSDIGRTRAFTRLD